MNDEKPPHDNDQSNRSLTAAEQTGRNLAAAHDGRSQEMTLEMNPDQVLLVAIQSGISGEGLNALLEARDRLRKEKQLEAFNEAFNKFQKNVPVIEKTKPVFNKDGITVRFMFAPIDDIWKQIKPYLSKNGFSVDSNTELVEREVSNYKIWIRAKVSVHHVDGYVKAPSIFEQPVVQSDFMSYQHSVTTARSVALRIALLDALGLVTADPDETVPEATASNVHSAMSALASFGVKKDQMMEYVGARHFGDISDTQLQKLIDVKEKLQEGYRAMDLFGGPTASDALDDTGPSPRDIYMALDHATSMDQVEQIKADLEDANMSKGHAEIAQNKLESAIKRAKAAEKKRNAGKPKQTDKPKSGSGAVRR